jgi:hypothetical protein
MDLDFGEKRRTGRTEEGENVDDDVMNGRKYTRVH